MKQNLYLEDLSVGARFHAGPLTVSAEEIKRFASEFDPQFFHLDEERAKASIFDGLVASGWHTAALTMKLLVGGGMPFADGAVGTGAELQWPRPVRPRDSLSVESEILNITPSRSRKDRGVVTLRTTTSNQNGEAVQILTSKIIVFSRVVRGVS
jgi:acyl dehydratase